MDYKSILTPVREFLQKMETVETITDHEEYKRYYSMLVDVNQRMAHCIKNPPEDPRIKEVIVKMHKALDSPRSFMMHSMLNTVNWVPAVETN